MKTISAKELEKLTKKATVKEIHELIIAGINEDIKINDKQLLKLVKLKGERNV